MYKKFNQFIYRRLIPVIRIAKKINWIKYLKTNKKINLIVGAGKTSYKNWFTTDISTLDVTNENDFKKYFEKKKINKILAEHVLEHLTDKDLKLMVDNFYKYSAEDINIRIAVPDGFHTDENYINRVKPGGFGDGADDHKHLFTYKTLGQLFEEGGFKSRPLEYWDENKIFHTNYQNDQKGYITRSFINDERNKDGNPNYSSLIIDFIK